jgi:hypothetical protein
MKLTDIQPLLVDALPLMTDEDIAHVIRQTRNHLLQQCDWTQLADSPLSPNQKADWADYRQALRDIVENNSTNLAETVFPIVPEV